MVKTRPIARGRVPATSLAAGPPSVRPPPYLLERMFPSRLIRGIDLAIEFATLGEYGLAPEPVPEAPRAFRVDLSGIGGETGASVERVAPSTPAARRLEAARSAAARPPRPQLPVPLPSRAVLRTRTFAPPSRVPA